MFNCSKQDDGRQQANSVNNNTDTLTNPPREERGRETKPTIGYANYILGDWPVQESGEPVKSLKVPKMGRSERVTT